MNPTPNTKPILNLSHLRDLTQEYGEGWAYAHVCRVLHLIEDIGSKLIYDENVTTYAAYLHDWGAFPHYHLPGVDHALRSMQVAETEVLPYTSLSEAAQQAVLDAISNHDYRHPSTSNAIEVHLLREADMLDMLGVVGILREFASGPNNLKTCYERILSRRSEIAGKLTLPSAQVIAEERFASMDQMLAQFRRETFDLI